MHRYDIGLFIHIVAAVIWLGGGFMLLLQATLADRSSNSERIKYSLEQISSIGNRLLIPASLIVFAVEPAPAAA